MERGRITADLVADGSLTINEAVKFTGISRDKWYELMRQGFPYSQVSTGGRRLLPKRAITRLLAKTMIIGSEWDWLYEEGEKLDAAMRTSPRSA